MAATFLGTGLLVAGCQDATVIGARNACEAPVEVEASNSRTEDPLRFDLIKPGDRHEVSMIVKRATSVFVWVRNVGQSDVPAPVEVLIADLAPGPRGAGYDVEVVVEGALCPVVSG